MSKFKNMQLQTLDKHLAQISVPELPSGGWIRAIRSSLGMTIQQLANRLGVAKQSAAKLESNEAEDVITLKSLRKAAEAMDCRLVYAFLPNDGSLQNTIQKQAHRKAAEIVNPVDHSMMLEAQAVDGKGAKIRELASELAQHPNSKLWD